MANLEYVMYRLNILNLNIQTLRKLFKGSLVYLKELREAGREIFHPRFAARKPAAARVGPAQGQEPELHLSLP